MPNLITRLLERSQNESLLLEFHTNTQDPEKFSVGWVISLSGEHYLMASVDEVGRPDGFQLGKVESLFTLVTGGDYLETISRSMLDHPVPRYDLPPVKDLESLLEWAQSTTRVFTFRHQVDADYAGIVKEVDSETFALDDYAKSGTWQGTHILKKDEVDRVSFGGPDEASTERMIALKGRKPS